MRQLYIYTIPHTLNTQKSRISNVLCAHRTTTIKTLSQVQRACAPHSPRRARLLLDLATHLTSRLAQHHTAHSVEYTRESAMAASYVQANKDRKKKALFAHTKCGTFANSEGATYLHAHTPHDDNYSHVPGTIYMPECQQQHRTHQPLCIYLRIARAKVKWIAHAHTRRDA